MSDEVKVPESHWLNSPSRGPVSKARMFGQIGLVLWVVWLLFVWRQASRPEFDSQADWLWVQAAQQVAFWLALVFTAIWVAATVWRDERSR